MKLSLRKILIANRGEIACRILRTIEKMGLRSVTVCSDVDINALHTKLSDEVYKFNTNKLNESYLSPTKIIEAAIQSKCDAIHPGYGFLSENANFAELCDKNNIIFIGPSTESIRKMGIKNVAKLIMESANIPIIKGYHGHDQNEDLLKEMADTIGYPIMIKPNLGGGGKGMKIVWNQMDFYDLLRSSKREAKLFFGDDNVMIEKFVKNPRHIEVQVFGDKFGNYVHLYERDCSIQRRHQKILEESPATNISENIREKLTETAVIAARAVNYIGAGTVEFLFDNDSKEFYFMEMNTRLQVEHPVTEMITDIDLVEWQIKVAAGYKLPLEQDQIKVKKQHVIEARIYAEDCDNNFMPTCGKILAMSKPKESSFVRIDTGLKEGDEITVYYDPMIAKMIVSGENRTNAIQNLAFNLKEFNIAGLKTNVNYLIKLITSEEFNDSRCIHTNFIEDNQQKFYLNDSKPEEKIIIRAALAFVLYDTFLLNENARKCKDAFNPFVLNAGFRVNHSLIRKFLLRYNNEKFKLRIKFLREKDAYEICLDESENWFVVRAKLIADKTNRKFQLQSEIGNLVSKNEVFIMNESVFIFSTEGVYEFINEDEDLERILKIKNDKVDQIMHSCVKSPLPGIIGKVYVKEGDNVITGDSLILINSMKMEYIIKAEYSSKIKEVLVHEGDNIKNNAVLINFESALK